VVKSGCQRAILVLKTCSVLHGRGFNMEKSKSCVNSCNSFPGITLEASIFYDSRAINIQIYSYIFKFQLIVTNPGIYLKRINNDTVDSKNS
jgi:hypothetical protein